ncbi:hypothetical protein C6401_13915 [Arthrobacter woluwensis]|uniref:helix-turn-helix domain-containing protein n=1 Tax=Arthrobacter woluwensis TaxID=156980 RepID=UPI000D131404|nr:AraC family transcriptional regulator [Arthrobacter woluwensis]PSS43137.1 hypothetical protein C6401_13915 [Arthrobacter woluwensis]
MTQISTKSHPLGRSVEWEIIENKLVVGGVESSEDFSSGVDTFLDLDGSGKFKVLPKSAPTFHASGISFYTEKTSASEVIVEGGTYGLSQEPGIGTVRASIVSQGTMILGSGKAATVGHAGHGLILRPGEDRTVEFSDGARILFIETSNKILERFSSRSAPGAALHFGPGNTLSESILAFGVSITRHRGMGPLDSYFIDQFLHEMVGSILASLSVASPGRRGRDGAFTHSQSLIDDRYMDPTFSVAELAASLKMSVRNLQGIYAERGKNAHQAIRDRRLREAKTLLSDPAHISLTIDEIAILSGLGNTQRLRRAFESADLPNPRTFRAQAIKATTNKG